MATVRHMARVVIMKRLPSNPRVSVFDDVSALSDADLLVEYNAIKEERAAKIAAERAELTAIETDLP